MMKFGSPSVRPWLSALTVMAGSALLLAVAGCSATVPEGEDSTSPSLDLTIPSEDGPGVTDSTIVVMDSERGFDETSDQYADAFVAHLNATGGISGRKVELIAAPELPQSANSTADQTRKAHCAALESGPEFFAFLGSSYECLAEMGRASINEVTLTSADVENPFTLAPSNMTDVRAAATLALRLREDGQLAEVKKVGVVSVAGDTYSDPAAEDALIAGLESGKTTYEVETFEAAGNSESDALSLTVQLKEAGVDFVVPANFFAADAIKVATFVAQDYAPGISGYGIYIPRDVVATLPAEFAERINQYGWRLNTYTVPQGQGELLTTSQPGAAECLEVAAEANLSTAGGALGSMLKTCDALRLLKASLENSGSKFVNAQAFVVGARGLDSFECSLAFSCTITEDHPDGASGVRMISFDAAQKAFVYQDETLEAAP